MRPFFDRLAADERSALSALATVRSFHHNERVINQGDPGDRVIVIRHGHAKIIGATADGRETLLAVQMPGDLVGELSYLDGRPRTATVIAVGRFAALSIDFVSFEKVLGQYPRVVREMACGIGAKLCAADRRRMEFGYTVPQRIARVLREMAFDPPAGAEPGIAITQRELGQLIGAAEVSVQKALRRLSREGLVSVRYGRIVITQPTALARFIGRSAEGQ